MNGTKGIIAKTARVVEFADEVSIVIRDLAGEVYNVAVPRAVAIMLHADIGGRMGEEINGPKEPAGEDRNQANEIGCATFEEWFDTNMRPHYGGGSVSMSDYNCMRMAWDAALRTQRPALSDAMVERLREWMLRRWGIEVSHEGFASEIRDELKREGSEG